MFHGVKPWELVDDPRYPPRLLLAYVRNLPDDSATVAAMRGGQEHRGWNTSAHLLASVVDAIQQNTYVLVASNSKRKPKPPQPLNRPKFKTQAKKNPQANKFAAMARGARKMAVRQANKLKESMRDD